MKQFKTESQKLLDLMINSIYTNREIFLRELISNASDALDKLSFLALTDAGARAAAEDLKISLSFDKDARTICVADAGIGMSEADLELNLGTIAHSGSEAFKRDNASAQGEAIDIIGQFGVGFYSAFMVADFVEVYSRAFGSDKTYKWSSDGKSGYTIEEADAASVSGASGTKIVLHIRENVEGEQEGESLNFDSYLTEWGLRDLVQRYSNYVRYPVEMLVTKSRVKENPEADENATPEYEDYQELECLNSMTPIWKKRESEVEEGAYAEFYKTTFHDWQDPVRVISLHIEGSLSFDALLFIPSQTPFDLYNKEYEKGLALYSSNVMIQEKCGDLLPDYLGFVKGIVSSPDVTLNISRETLQQNSQLKAIAKRIERKIVAELKKMLEDDFEAYEKIWENFGRSIKFGIYNSYGSKAQELQDLLLFRSATSQKRISLKDYAEAQTSEIEAVKDKILFAAGEDAERLGQSPKVKAALAHGVDVLICDQDVDEFMFQVMRNYHFVPEEGEERDFELVNVASADLDLATEEEKEAADKAKDENKDLLESLKNALTSRVSDVRIGSGMGDVAATLAADGPLSLAMEKTLAQGPDAEHAPKAERVLQLNPSHKVFAKLVAAKAAGDDRRLEILGKILADQAVLLEGLPLDDPQDFANNLIELM